MHGSRAVRALAAAAVLLLGTAVIAAAVERPGTGAPPTQVDAASLSQSALPDTTAPARVTATTVVTTTSPAPTTLTTPTTRTAPPRPATTTPTLPPGAPIPPTTPATGIPNGPPASSWQAEGQGITVRLRVDPATPQAGQPARFVVDVSTVDACCTVLLDFGDGTSGWSLNNGRACETSPPLKAGPLSTTTTHTYAAPGAYKASLAVFTGDSCANSPLAPGAAPPPPFLGAAHITACVGIGPGTAAQQGCSPFPTFGPDSIISPVLDPFCQVRSDCTQASPPR